MVKYCIRLIKAVALSLVFVISAFSVSCSNNTEQCPVIYIPDIGKADAILITYKEKAVMIDTGEKEDEIAVKSILNEAKVKKIDYLILTHFDKDHIGNAEALINEFNVENVYQTGIADDTDIYLELQNCIKTKSIPVFDSPEDSSVINIDDLSFNIYFPQLNSYENKQDNNSSLIISMKYGDSSLLFCGDALDQRLTEFIETNTEKFDLIKAPYHGNWLDIYPKLFDNTNFKNVIITSSKKNPESQKLIDFLNEKQVNIHLTRLGKIKIEVEKFGIQFK